MVALYNRTAVDCCRQITKNYSTSFYMGIRLFGKTYREPICVIYSFFRYADEIVDTFNTIDQKTALERFKSDTWNAIEMKFSSNPILQAFQQVVYEYNIDYEQIKTFLKSMEMDLYNSTFDNKEYNQYIFGSAEVVGLMCLRIFYKDNDQEYNALKAYAQSLGSAFQKVNFLRDVQDDYVNRGRVYFPAVSFENFTESNKMLIEQDIDADFKKAIQGIQKLKKEVRSGVYLAYVYYTKLFNKIKAARASEILKKRYRINNLHKVWLLIVCRVGNMAA